MEYSSILGGDTKKAGITIIEAEVVEENQLRLDTTNASSTSKLATVSFDTLPPPRASNLFDATSKPRNTLKDTGWPAWGVLLAAIMVQGTLFAFPLTFGVFQNFFSQEQRSSNAKSSIWIGVLSTGVPFLAAPFMTILCEKHSQTRWRYYIMLGWIICFVSLIGASFTKSILALALTQGVLYAIGLILIDVPTLLIVNTWFVKRRGTAYGVLFGLTDLIGFGMTILAEFLLRGYGLRSTLLTFGCSTLVVCGPAIWFLRPLPATTLHRNHFMSVAQRVQSAEEEADLTLTPLMRRATSNLCSKTTTRYFRLPIFYIFALANTFHAVAYYLPFMYLPSYATSLGYHPTSAAYLLAGANFAQIFGEISFGQLSDRINVHWLIVAGSLVSSIATLIMWGLAQNYAVLAVFALIFGSFGSGMISLWARMGTFFGHNDAQMIYSIMSLGRGLGSITSGPISSALLTGGVASRVSAGSGGVKYGNGRYAGVVFFVGLSMAASALMGVVGLFVTWRGGEDGNRRGLSRRKQRESFQVLKDQDA